MESRAIASSGNASINDHSSDSCAYERKSALISAHLDKMGMGRYQWSLFFLCGFGYCLDLMWAQAFGICAVAFQHELGFKDSQYGFISTSFSVGLSVGALVWGMLVDIVGRKWAFNFTVAISSAFGICLAFPSSYTLICILTALTGLGIGGNIPVDSTIFLEFIPHDKRHLIVALSIFQPIGTILASGIGYALIPRYACDPDLPACDGTGAPCCTKESNMGWRYTFFVIGAITIAAFVLRFVLFNFKESPQFLLSKGRDEEAVAVVQAVAKYNKQECTLTFSHMRELSDVSNARGADATDSTPLLGSPPAKSAGNVIMSKLKAFDLSHLKFFVSTPAMAWLTVLTCVMYAGDFWGFSLTGGFLPLILARKGRQLDMSVQTTYRNYIIIQVCGMPGCLIGSALAMSRMPKKWSMVLTSALMGASCFLFVIVNSEAGFVGFNALEYFAQSMFNAILYAWTPETFEGRYRGTACGLASAVGRATSIVAPLIGNIIFAMGMNYVLYAAGVGVFVSTTCALLLPTKAVENARKIALQREVI